MSPTYFAASFRPHPASQAFPDSSERLIGEEFHSQTPGIIFTIHQPNRLTGYLDYPYFPLKTGCLALTYLSPCNAQRRAIIPSYLYPMTLMP